MKEDITLRKVQESGWKVCIYGLGTMTKMCCPTYMKYMNIVPDYFCDKNSSLLDKVDKDKRITVEELKLFSTDMWVFAFVSLVYKKSIINELQINKNLHLLFLDDIFRLVNSTEIIKDFYNVDDIARIYHNDEKYNSSIIKNQYKGERIAVYTCITNGYDNVEPIYYEDPNCDYYLITDISDEISILNDNYYHRINICDVVPADIVNPKDQNRYCKMHGYKIFPNYKYSIYVDGRVNCVGALSDLINGIGNRGLALHKHSFINDLYIEIIHLVLFQLVDEENAKEVARKYIKEGLPRNYGMLECGVIITDHTNHKAIEVLENWFDSYYRSCVKRDQLHLIYNIWKMNINVDEIGTLEGSIWSNKYFNISHKHNMKV